MLFSLFELDVPEPILCADGQRILTPVGELVTYAVVNGVRLGAPEFSAALTDAYFYKWAAPGLAELCVFKLPSIGPLNCPPAVEEAWAFIWRIRSEHPIFDARFVAEWPDPPDDWSADPASGERLEALEGEFGDVVFALGTEDAESLHSRCMTGRWMPHRWAASLNKFSVNPVPTERSGADGSSHAQLLADDPVVYRASGLEMRIRQVAPFPVLPTFRSQPDDLQVHFIAGWMRAPDPEDVVLPWLAVDAKPDFVVERLRAILEHRR